MWRLFDRHRICPGYRPTIIAEEKGHMSLEIIKQPDNSVPRQVQSLRDGTWRKWLGGTGEFLDHELTNAVMVF
jgi:hypothetical protein